MKFLLYCFCLLQFIGIGSSAQAEQKLMFITEEWAPYNYSQNGDLTGFSTEIIQAMMDELKEEHEIRVYPGPRTHKILESQSNVMAYSYFRTPEREEKYKWIGPLVDEVIYLYKRKDDIRQFNDIEDARKVNSIAVANKGIVQDKLERLNFKNFEKFSGNKDQIIHVLMGRSDLLANFTQMGLAYYLRSIGEPTDALIPTKVELVRFSLNIACSKDIPDEVIQRWQGALDAIRKSGKYDVIYQKYLE